MLKFLVVEPEQERRYDPISMAVSAPVLDSQHCERFPEIALQRHTVKKCRVIRRRIMRRIVKWGKIIFEATTNAQACIFEGFVQVGQHLGPDRSQRSSILPPDSQAVTGMSAHQLLINKPSIQERRC